MIPVMLPNGSIEYPVSYHTADGSIFEGRKVADPGSPEYAAWLLVVRMLHDAGIVGKSRSI